MQDNHLQIQDKIDVKGIVFAEPERKIGDFLNFCKKDISRAVVELQKITEKERKHLQKLVYTNLVDRFDHLIDELIIWSGINNPEIRNQLFKEISDEPISKRDVLQMLYKGKDIYKDIEEEILSTARSTLLRETHSNKVRKIIVSVGWNNPDLPRVYNNNGKILERTKKHKFYPNSIHGYADWLYIRRSSLVHGASPQYSQSIRDRFKNQYKVDLPKGIAVSVGSIQSSLTFYQDFCDQYFERLKKFLDS